MLRWMNKILMDEAGGADGSGSGGAPPSLLTTPGAGGEAAPDKGPGSSGDAPAKDQPAAGGGTGNSSGGTSSTDWRSSLPKDLQDNASIKKFPDAASLAGAYVNAQKLIGADKIAIPNPKTATAEDWANVYSKLGLPDTVEKYDVKFKDGVTIDAGFAKEFRENAHKMGILPSQAQGLADWFSGITAGSEESLMKERAAHFDTGVAALRKEWGNAFDLNIARANKLIQDTGGVEYFQKMGYGSDPMLMKYIAGMAEKVYKDPKIFDKAGGGGAAARTPDQIKSAIGRLQADNAYNSKDHPHHDAAVKEMSSLHQELHQNVDKK